MKLGFRPLTTADVFRSVMVRWAIALAIASSLGGMPFALAQEDEIRDPTRVQGFLRTLDKNGDGQLTPEEVGRQGGRIVRTLARRGNLNPDGPLSISALVGQAGKTESKPAGTAPAATPAPSFGGGSGGNTASLEYRERADKLITENDKNNNGVLDGEEVKSIPSKYKGADLNGDGSLTRDEVVAKISEINSKLGNVSSAVAAAPPPSFGGPNASSGGPRSGGPGSGGPGSGGPGQGRSGRFEGRGRGPGDRSGGDRPGGYSGGPPSGGYQGQSKMRRPGEAGPDVPPGQRKSFRIKSATERFPKGLPDWFARSDADGDGQVSMAEYAVSWNEAKAQEYAKLDANEDGFVTVAEALASVNGGRRPTFPVAGPPGGGPPGVGPMPTGTTAPAVGPGTSPSGGPPSGGPPSGGPPPGAPPPGGPPGPGGAPPAPGGAPPASPGANPSAAPMPATNSPMPAAKSDAPPSNPPSTNTPPPAGGTPTPMPPSSPSPTPPRPGFGSPPPAGR